jgi:hypothetical protein
MRGKEVGGKKKGEKKKERKRIQITAHPSVSQFTLPQKNNAQNTKSH